MKYEVNTDVDGIGTVVNGMASSLEEAIALAKCHQSPTVNLWRQEYSDNNEEGKEEKYYLCRCDNHTIWEIEED